MEERSRVEEQECVMLSVLGLLSDYCRHIIISPMIAKCSLCMMPTKLTLKLANDLLSNSPSWIPWINFTL